MRRKILNAMMLHRDIIMRVTFTTVTHVVACDGSEGCDKRNVTVYVIDCQRYACRCDSVILNQREFNIRLIYLQTF